MPETKKEPQISKESKNACSSCYRKCRIRNESREIVVNYCSAFVSGVSRYEQSITQTKLGV